MALVSDAGMPGISDPGFVLVQQAVEAGVKVIPVPGACALIAALVASGLPTDSFTFCGFLPPKQGVGVGVGQGLAKGLALVFAGLGMQSQRSVGLFE